MQGVNIPQEDIQQEPPAIPQPKIESKGSSKKLLLIVLWFITAIIFAGLGAFGYWFLTREKQEESKVEPETRTCIYDGKTYASGNSFEATDGCNICFCNDDGQVGCTEMQCITDNQTEPSDSETKEEDGYIEEAYQEGGKDFIKFATIEFIDAGNEEKFEEFCGDEPYINCPNDYYIDKSNSEILDLEITEDSIIEVLLKYDGDCTLTSDPEEESGFKSYSISYSDLVNSACIFIGEDAILFTVSYKDSSVIELSEVYLP